MRISSGLRGWWSEKRKHPIRSLIVFGVLIAVSLWLEEWRPTKHASWLIWDAIETAFFSPKTPKDRQLRPLSVIVVSAEDYQTLFRRASPLDPDGLAEIVARALMRGSRDIFVDLETADEQFTNLPDLIQKSWCRLDAQGCESRDVIEGAVTWAQGGVGSEDGVRSLLPFLGSEPPRAKSALAFLQPDSDGRVRRAREFLEVNGQTRSTIVGAAAAALEHDGEGRAEHDSAGSEELRPSFQRRLTALQTIDAQTFVTSPELYARNSHPAEVVLIGGSYSAADRFYAADGREHPGVAIVAAMALALASKDEVHEHGVFVGLLIALAVGAGVSYLSSPYSGVPPLGVPPAVLFLFLLLIGAAIVTRISVVNLLALFGVAGGMLLHLVVEQSERLEEVEGHFRKQQTEFEATRGEIAQLNEKLEECRGGGREVPAPAPVNPDVQAATG